MKVLSVLCLLILATAAVAAPARSNAKRGPAKRPPTKMAPRKATPYKPNSAAARSNAARKGTAASSQRSNARRGSNARRSAPPRASYQTAPTPDRYREIQQALVEKGYLKSEPTGQWNTESIEAMRRFQQDQNLDATGKLDSLSLIALGLGPKRTATAQVRPQ